ncbi:triosephosphate isomerase [Candidatus Kaiserbacteria bacterium]|nr:triosephosphate isomerase [Candidatus Kaiserbacteria bacterium]
MKSIVVANWKMNPASFREAKKLFDAERKAAEKARGVSVVVAPPAIFLRELSSLYRGSKIAFSAQNAHFDVDGAHTGEISLLQVKDARAKFVLVGHAERRAEGETDDDTRKKVAAALSLKLAPILCVGEARRTDEGEQFEAVREQLRAGLADVAASALSRVLLVYEPLWTIGKEETMDPHEMHQMAIFMRKCVVESHGEAGLRHAKAGSGLAQAGRNMKILYGGSIEERNAAAMLRDGDIHGFLVGRASANAIEFAKLLRAIEIA